MKKKFAVVTAPVALALMGMVLPATANASTNSAAQTSTQSTAVTDEGPASGSQVITGSIVLKIRHQDQLEQFIQDTVTPGSSNYHQYLSVDEFRQHYAPSQGQLKQVLRYLSNYGIQGNPYQDGLLIEVTGTVDAFNAAFGTDLHNYTQNGEQFHAPKHHPHIPKVLQDDVLALVGLNNYPSFKPMNAKAKQVSDAVPPAVTLPKDGTATNIPGDYTVGDVANRYDINPLYQAGITGAGQTIGIVTLANFLPSDAYTYWDSIGLKYKPNRITQIHVDGGGQLGAAAGSGETTLDVEQSGGLAPDADIRVYDAPNTDAGFIDVFYQAVSENLVNTLSVSWGQPEAFYMNSPLSGGDYTDELAAFHQVFMEGAAQGISMFAAAGDSGAYDTNRNLPYPGFSKLISADAPASDPYITAAGGTTVPTTIQMKHGTVAIPAERPWAWDYLNDYLVQNYGPGAKDAYFAIGDGGAVSSVWPLPWYQQGISGMQVTPSGQSLDVIQDYKDANGNVVFPAGTHLLSLPSGFAGRNESDISMNADPETGYLVYSTEDGGWVSGYGGTSFVAPQLNGITALLNQYVGSPVGFLNPTLYSLMQTQGYGANAPFQDITTGDNWFYQAGQGYDPASGIGTPNVANLAQAIKSLGN